MRLHRKVLVLFAVQIVLSILWLGYYGQALGRRTSWIGMFVRLEDHPCRLRLGSNSRENCVKLFEDSQYFVQHTTTQRTSNGSDECDLESLVQNCPLLTSIHEYATEPSSGNDAEFPIAFAIKLHKSPQQAEALLRTIYQPQNVYCIHVDKKYGNKIQDIFVNISKCFDNVHVVHDRVPVKYASFDHIVVELKLMKLCKSSEKIWKYYINLTGQEFPLKTNSEIVKILKLINGSNDIESYPMPRDLVQERIGLLSDKFDKLETVLEGKELFKGSAYGVFSRDFVDFILEDKTAKDIINLLNNTKSPEETVWATLNRLSVAPGGTNVDVRHDSNQHLSKAVVWKWDRATCNGVFVRSVCVFGRGDLAWLRNKPQLFANKFDAVKDPVATECLEEEIRNRTREPREYFLNLNFYRQLPYVLHRMATFT